MLGRRGVAPRLVEQLKKTNSTMLQARILLALGRLDHDSAVEPLLQLLRDKSARRLVREFAAVALGLMGDRREVDPLFSVDAFFNFYATTVATHELVRLY